MQILGAIQSVGLGLIIFFGRDIISSFYTNIEEVAEEASKVLMFHAFFYQIDAMQAVVSGVMRGIGKLNDATICAIIGYYIISVPMEYLFAFKLDFGVMGLWMGQLAGCTFHALSIYYLLYFHYDWNLTAALAKQRHD